MQRQPQIDDLVQIKLPNQEQIITSILNINGPTLYMKKSGVKLTWNGENWLLADGLIPNEVKFYISPKRCFQELCAS